MLTYLLPTAATLALGLFYRLGGASIVKETCRHKYTQWKSINELVATQETCRFWVVILSIRIVLSTLYLSLVQYMSNSVRRLDPKTYEISYTVEGKSYRFVTKVRRGPAPVTAITDGGGNDLTNTVLQYFGPRYDWHGSEFSPRFFCVDSLTFLLPDGVSKTFVGGARLPSL
jgi:hypothetical protein